MKLWSCLLNSITAFSKAYYSSYSNSFYFENHAGGGGVITLDLHWGGGLGLWEESLCVNIPFIGEGEYSYSDLFRWAIACLLKKESTPLFEM